MGQRVFKEGFPRPKPDIKKVQAIPFKIEKKILTSGTTLALNSGDPVALVYETTQAYLVSPFNYPNYLYDLVSFGLTMNELTGCSLANGNYIGAGFESGGSARFYVKANQSADTVLTTGVPTSALCMRGIDDLRAILAYTYSSTTMAFRVIKTNSAGSSIDSSPAPVTIATNGSVVDIVKMSENRFAVLYWANSTQYPTIVTLTLSGDTITLGTPQVIASHITETSNMKMVRMDDNTVAVACTQDVSGKKIRLYVCALLSSTWTISSGLVANDSHTVANSLSVDFNKLTNEFVFSLTISGTLYVMTCDYVNSALVFKYIYGISGSSNSACDVMFVGKNVLFVYEGSVIQVVALLRNNSGKIILRTPTFSPFAGQRRRFDDVYEVSPGVATNVDVRYGVWVNTPNGTQLGKVLYCTPTVSGMAIEAKAAGFNTKWRRCQ